MKPRMPRDAHTPPGPRGLPLLGSSLDLLHDSLSLLARAARTYGGVARLRLGPRVRILLSHPREIEQVLVVQQQKFSKSPMLRRVAERLLGQGLLVSEGELWRRQRRLVQPAFHRARLAAYAPVMVEEALAQLAGWRAHEQRDLAEEMMRLTLRIAVRTLFGAELDEEAFAVGDALRTIQRYDLRRLRSPVQFPESWPTPANRRAARAHAYLDRVVYRIIEQKRAARAGDGDVLSLLLGAMDEDGTRMTSRQVRDETMTLFIAGHETTALLLAWTWRLLAENPAARARLEEELARVLAGRPPALDDLARLPYTEAVVNEALRLYPPAYVLTRTSLEPVDLGGYAFPENTTFLLSQWVVQRDPQFFAEPEAFRPERWLDRPGDPALRGSGAPPYAYFPFGAGPRRCIGEGFALIEAALVIATIGQRWRFRPLPRPPIVLEPLVTLRPKYGIPMELEERAEG
jgi:cytochrome P450